MLEKIKNKIKEEVFALIGAFITVLWILYLILRGDRYGRKRKRGD